MKLTKEQANNLLTEIKEVLAKGIDYSNFVIVRKKDGLHLASVAKTEIILDVNATVSLISTVHAAKDSRRLTLFTQEFPNILINYLTSNKPTEEKKLTMICESIVNLAKKIDEHLGIMYTYDISPVIADTVEHTDKAKEILNRTYDYSFGQNNAFYPDNYEYITKLVRDYYPKYETLEAIERTLGISHIISKLLNENKLTVESLETYFKELPLSRYVEVLPIAKNVFLNTERLLTVIYSIRTSLEKVAQFRVLYEHHRKAIDDTI